MSVTYINSITHGAFDFVDYTFKSAFTFVDTFSVEFWWKRTVTFSIIYFGLATKVPKLTHYGVVLFHPRA